MAPAPQRRLGTGAPNNCYPQAARLISNQMDCLCKPGCACGHHNPLRDHNIQIGLVVWVFTGRLPSQPDDILGTSTELTLSENRQLEKVRLRIKVGQAAALYPVEIWLTSSACRSCLSTILDPLESRKGGGMCETTPN